MWCGKCMRRHGASLYGSVGGLRESTMEAFFSFLLLFVTSSSTVKDFLKPHNDECPRRASKKSGFCIIYFFFFLNSTPARWQVIRVDSSINRTNTCLIFLEIWELEKALHSVERDTQEHAVLCKLKGALQSLRMTEGELGYSSSYPLLTARGQPKRRTYANQCHCYETNRPR